MPSNMRKIFQFLKKIWNGGPCHPLGVSPSGPSILRNEWLRFHLGQTYLSRSVEMRPQPSITDRYLFINSHFADRINFLDGHGSTIVFFFFFDRHGSTLLFVLFRDVFLAYIYKLKWQIGLVHYWDKGETSKTTHIWL